MADLPASPSITTPRLHLLGVPAVLQDGRALSGAAAQPRRLAVLALLARAGARGMTRDKLIGILWPDMEDEKGRRALTHALYALRRDLGNEGAITGSDTLRLEPSAIGSDVADFDAALMEGRLEDAAALYDGPFLDGFHVEDAGEFERWVDGERAELAREYADVLESLARSAASAGRHRHAADWWRRRAAEDPLNAGVAVALMESLEAGGDRAAALRHAEIYEVLLDQELALPPDRAVTTLAARLRSVPAPAPAPAVGADLVSAVPKEEGRHKVGPYKVGPYKVGPATRRRGPVLLAAVAVLAVAAILGLRSRTAGGGAAPRLAVGRVADYRNGTSLGGPLTDLLATNLARVPGLDIISSARLYELVREAGADTGDAALASAARLAGATQLLEGSLYALPDGRLRLDLRRMDVASGALVGAERVEAPDLFALVDSGTARLARKVGRSAPGGSVADVTTGSLVAARLYDDGLHRFHRGDRAGAAPLFEAALAEDSAFAMAAYYAALTSQDRAAWIARMRHAVAMAPSASRRERLLITATYYAATRDPRLADVAPAFAEEFPAEIEGHLFLAQTRLERGEFAGAVAELNRAIAMAGGPRDADEQCPDCEARRSLVAAYEFADSLDAALRVAQEWTRLRPSSAIAWTALADVQEARGEGDAALAAYRRAASLDPAFNGQILLAVHRIWRDDYEGAATVLRELAAASAPAIRGEALWMLAIALRQQGRLPEALDAMRRRRAITPGDSPRGAAATVAAQEAQILLEMGRPREAGALFDSISRWHVPLEDEASRSRGRIWWLAHSAEAWFLAGDTARTRSLADTLRILGATTLSGRDSRLFHYVQGLLLKGRGDTAGAVRELRQAMYSPTLGFTRINAELARLLMAQGEAAEAIALLEPALRGGLEGSNLYVTRPELRRLLAEARRPLTANR